MLERAHRASSEQKGTLVVTSVCLAGGDTDGKHREGTPLADEMSQAVRLAGKGTYGYQRKADR